MVNDEEKIAEYLKLLAKEGTATLEKSSTRKGLKVYKIKNNNTNLAGEILVTDMDEIAYCEFSGFSNNKYLRGEAISYDDLRLFVNAVQDDEPKEYKGLFGRCGIRFQPSGIRLNRLID